MNSEQRQKARELRGQGLTTTQISQELKVSKSSVSLWVRDIELSKKQVESIQLLNPIFNRQLGGGKVKADKARDLRLQYQEEGKLKAKESNLLHQAACMLYWAEGAKSKNQCRFTNSDVNMVKLFVRFLRECFCLTNDKITITINCYTTNGFTKEEIENYWLDQLQLDNSSLRKGQENNRPRSMTNAIRYNKLIYGIVCVTINSTKLVQHIYGAIQEYVGFNNNYMLM